MLEWHTIVRTTQLVVMLTVTSVATAAPLPDKADCRKIYDVNKKAAYTANPEEVHQCIMRGWDPPKNWRPRDGKTRAVVSGSGGFSFGTVASPENSPGKRNANASVNGNIILSSCNFPPRIRVSLTPPYVNFPAGSCYDYIMRRLFRDNGGNPSTGALPTGVDQDDKCPAESDTTGQFGVKSPLPGAGGTVPTPQGGMMPTTTTDVVLNANPTAFAATENGSYWIWYYIRQDGQPNQPFVNPNVSGANPSGAIQMPTYLCTPDGDGFMMKTVDLTPPAAQMITYNPQSGSISIRLQSRVTMDQGFIPPYDPAEPEKYLVLPLDANGVPQVPPDCGLESAYYRLPDSRQDILMRPSTINGCESASVTSAQVNDVCPGAVYQARGGCLSTGGNGAPPLAIPKQDNWLAKCPPTPEDPSPAPLADGRCPQDQGIPGESQCGRGDYYADANCDNIKLSLPGSIVQFGVLNRPNLYYPPGSGAVVHSMNGGRTALLAETAPNSVLYTQSSTEFYLQETAPPLVFNEGGTIPMANGEILIMEPPSTVAMGPNVTTVTMTRGGQRVSAGGVQLEGFGEGATYAITGPRYYLPLLVRAGRSVTFPQGFLIPTQPRIAAQPPYMRLPLSLPVGQ
ncbi:MAG: hypothetical protein ACOYNL_10030 [Rickettsiales bacterium]